MTDDGLRLFDYDLLDGARGVSDESLSGIREFNRIEKHFFSPISRLNNTAQRFFKLTNEWKKDTEHISSVTGISMHPAYQQIIGMGPVALPLIFAELRREPHHWFWALKSITGQDPVTKIHRGNLSEMANDWLQWAAENRIVSHY